MSIEKYSEKSFFLWLERATGQTGYRLALRLGITSGRYYHFRKKGITSSLFATVISVIDEVDSEKLLEAFRHYVGLKEAQKELRRASKSKTKVSGRVSDQFKLAWK